MARPIGTKLSVSIGQELKQRRVLDTRVDAAGGGNGTGDYV
jgi:hypothetical protein